MSNVNLHIAGRDYAVACADGEEAHVAGLGRLISEKLEEMGGSGAQSEVRTLLFSALLLADEVHELRNRPEPEPAPPARPVVDPELDKALVSIAARLENIAMLLEREPEPS